MKRLATRGVGIIMAGLVLVSSACAYSMGQAPDARRAHDPDGGVYLNVVNHSGRPMEIFATGSGTIYRMGTVLPGLQSRLVIRPGMIVNGTVEFRATSGNAPAFRSGPILLAPGDVVDLQLEDQSVISSATVRPRAVPETETLGTREKTVAQ
jgi:hypothetical protein